MRETRHARAREPSLRIVGEKFNRDTDLYGQKPPVALRMARNRRFTSSFNLLIFQFYPLSGAKMKGSPTCGLVCRCCLFFLSAQSF